MEIKKDILSENDVRLMVDTFYDKVNSDILLSAVFNDFAKIDWKHHLPKMYAFWNFLLLGIPGYKGQPFPMHIELPITQVHFSKWLELFKKNVDEQFSGLNANIAKTKAESIAMNFQYKLGILK
jgi:hemoglobin